MSKNLSSNGKGKIKFYGYKKCGNCIKAEKLLQNAGVVYEFTDITQNPPSLDELTMVAENADIILNKLFNTSGIQYRELKIKERLSGLTKLEILSLLANNGRLIKRPLITDGEKATVGFKEDQLSKVWCRAET
ncbi:MAG: Spx/MgsR family RNA polymerase-binding regulatory protein [Nitrosomonas sp.]|nr:Spx/MgsR family RNA polymerase-binding regulatory protein [Nitrosomonas sp.]